MDDARSAPGGIAGLPTDEAARRVAGPEEDRDPEAVRSTLRRVADDGTVTRDAAESALAHLAKVVSTAETRTELAGSALADAREAAADAPDLAVVEARLSAFEADVSAVEARAAELGEDLGDLVDAHETSDLYDLARGIERLDARAREVQRTADELQVDLEEFERWVGDHGTRVRELTGDVDAFEEFLDGVAETVEDLPAEGEGGPARPGDQTADPDRSEGGSACPEDPGADPAREWFDTTLRRSVAGALLADLRADLDGLRAWADRGEIPPPPDDLGEKLDDLDARRERLGERLDAAARPAWREEFGDRVTDFEAALGSPDPPVDWGRVLAVLDEHRPRDDHGGTGEDR